MTKIIDLKELAGFLHLNRNFIIKRWLDQDEVKNIVHRHSLPIIDKNINLFYEFCDCFISVIEWNFTIAECKVKKSFLMLLSSYGLSTPELYTLIMKLKGAINQVMYESGNLSYSFQKELENMTIEIANELSSSFEQINSRDAGYTSEQSNLLSEYKKAVDLSSIVSKTNPKGIITYVNDKFTQISGYTRGELLGNPHSMIRHPSMERETFKNMWATLRSKKPWHGIVTNMAKDGSQYIVDSTIIPILDVDGDIIEYIAVRHDITELQATKEQLRNINKAMKNKVDELYSLTSSLEQKVTVDGLTGISNRVKFEEVFAQEIVTAQEYNKSLGLILFDIDHFKIINDTYGHQTGDNVLKELASLISMNIKTSDIIARWGGEEFVIILPDTNIDGAMLFAEKLRKIIQLHQFEGVGNISASFGVGQLEEYEDKMTFFEKVDKALYIAKNNGRNRVEKSIFNCVL